MMRVCCNILRRLDRLKCYLLSAVILLVVLSILVQNVAVTNYIRASRTIPIETYTDIIRSLESRPITKLTPLPKRSPHARRNVHFHLNFGCASETVSSIFVYHGLKNDLTFATSTGEYNKRHRPFSRKEVTPRRGVNLLVTEAFIDDESIDEIFENKNVLHITTACRPYKIFENRYTRSNLSHCFNGMSFEDFFKYEKLTELSNGGMKEVTKRCPYLTSQFMLSQPMSASLGMDGNQIDNFTYVIEKVKKITDRYDLVIFPDKMDELLVLMRDLLGWTTEDIITFTRNHRMTKTNFFDTNGERRGKQDQINWVDSMVYNAFRKKMTTTLKNYQDYFNAEKTILRKFRRKIENLCIESHEPGNETSTDVTSERIDSQTYTLKPGMERDLECYLRASPLKTLRKFLSESSQSPLAVNLTNPA